MLARGYSIKDIDRVKALFDQYYSEDASGKLTFPDFMKGFLCAFTITDENKQIITAGGVRLIAEACIITDKSVSPRKRVEALRETLRVCKFISKDQGFDYFHAVTDDPTWAHHMRKNGFVDRGTDLLIHVGDIK